MDTKQDGKAYAEMDWIGRMVNPAPLEYTLHSIGDRRLESALNGVIKVLKENNLCLLCLAVQAVGGRRSAHRAD